MRYGVSPTLRLSREWQVPSACTETLHCGPATHVPPRDGLVPRVRGASPLEHVSIIARQTRRGPLEDISHHRPQPSHMMYVGVTPPAPSTSTPADEWLGWLVHAMSRRSIGLVHPLAASHHAPTPNRAASQASRSAVDAARPRGERRSARGRACEALLPLCSFFRQGGKVVSRRRDARRAAGGALRSQPDGALRSQPTAQGAISSRGRSGWGPARAP